VFASSHEPLFLSAALVPAALAAVTDLRERRIPNWLTGSTLISGLGLHAALQGIPGVCSAALAALIAGACFLVFFLAGGMGAGDVKLMAALGAVVGMPALFLILCATTLAGALAAMALAIYHRRVAETLGNVAALFAHHRREGLKPHPELNLASTRTLRLPFAVPIALGCGATVVYASWSHPW
jgi:prepilin peptidase CpaA